MPSIQIPGSNSITMQVGQQLEISFTETVFLCWNSLNGANLFNNAPFPSSGSEHASGSSWSGTAMGAGTVSFWNSNSPNCAEYADTRRSITIGSSMGE